MTRPSALFLLGGVFALGIATGVVVAPGPVGRTFAREAAAPALPVESPAPRGLAGTAYPAQVLNVVDGDTFEARVRVWPGFEVMTKVRLRGIDAPEFRARCAEEYEKAEKARSALAALLAEGEVSVADVGLDKYGGRVLASAATRATADVSAALLAGGLVRPYHGGRRQGWCEFSETRGPRSD